MPAISTSTILSCSDKFRDNRAGRRIARNEDEAGREIDEEPDHAERNELLERLDRDALAEPEHAGVGEPHRADDRGHAEEVQDLADRPHPVVLADEIAEIEPQEKLLRVRSRLTSLQAGRCP
jgi:hypothetical protein